MNHIFFITGPTGSGKDTIIKNLLEKYLDPNKFKVLYRYTSRPKRKNNKDFYKYTTNDCILSAALDDELIEYESYIVNEITDERWMYCTFKSDIELNKYNYIISGSLNLFNSFRDYYENKNNNILIPIYIDCNAKIRLYRSLSRAGYSDEDIYEVCRRIYSDSIQFSKEKIKDINPVIINNTDDNYNKLRHTCENIAKFILSRK